MTWDWKHYWVKCRNCEWFAQYFPPDQKPNQEMEAELKKTPCPNCKGWCRVTWKG